MNPISQLVAAWRLVRDRPALLLMSALPATQLTEHFSRAEAGCRDGRLLPLELVANATEVALALEVLRAEVGRPIRVNSWYRSAEHTVAVGSKETSQHRLARAVDIVIAGMTPGEVFFAIEGLIAAGRMKQGGLGIYAPRTGTPTRRARAVGWVHYDVRGRKARWAG